MTSANETLQLAAEQQAAAARAAHTLLTKDPMRAVHIYYRHGLAGGGLFAIQADDRVPEDLELAISERVPRDLTAPELGRWIARNTRRTPFLAVAEDETHDAPSP